MRVQFKVKPHLRDIKDMFVVDRYFPDRKSNFCKGDAAILTIYCYIAVGIFQRSFRLDGVIQLNPSY